MDGLIFENKATLLCKALKRHSTNRCKKTFEKT